MNLRYGAKRANSGETLGFTRGEWGETGESSLELAFRPPFSPSPGYNKQDLKAAMHRLMGAGRLQRRKVGQYSNRMPKFGLVAT